MGRNGLKRTMAGILAIVLLLGLVVSGIAGLASMGAPAGNVAHLMESGLPEDKARAFAEELERVGFGELTGIKVDDTGEGYDLTLYDDEAVLFASVDYYGNITNLGGQDYTEQEKTAAP